MADLKKTLLGVLGSAAATIALVTSVTTEESGRTVAVTVAPGGQMEIRHVAGRQYLRAYLDAVKVPTACDGITRGVKMGQVYTPAQCTTLLERELVEHADQVMRCVPELRERPNAAAASVSLAYNIGWPSFCKSTAARRFRARQWAAGCDAFTMWNRAGGRVLVGLVARRARERALCRTGL